MIYTEKYTVTWHDTDANRCVRPSPILMYMQETANRHLQAYGCDLDCLRDERGLGFLLSRITLRIYEPLYAYEEIEAQTWICESRGLSFNRCFRILRGETVIAEAFTVWALMDLRARRLVSNEEFIYPFEGEEFGYVLEGKILIHVGEYSYKAKKGDAFYIMGDKEHQIVNVGTKECKIIWVATPSNF